MFYRGLFILFSALASCVVYGAQDSRLRAQFSDNRIRLRSESFDPLNRHQQRKNFDSAFIVKNSELKLIQFRTQWLEKYGEELERLGVDVFQYVPERARIARVPEGVENLVKALPYVRWLGPLQPFHKIDPDLLQEIKNESLLCNILILDSKEGTRFEEAELDRGQLIAKARSDSVVWIEQSTEAEFDEENAREQGGANAIEFEGVEGYTGIGIRGHVLEGIDPSHPEFAANSYRGLPIGVGDSTPSPHGQKTFGVLFGSGWIDSRARGILPDAQGLFTEFLTGVNPEYDGGAIGNRKKLVSHLIADHQIVFQTASWGYRRSKNYTARSAEIDQLIFELDLPIIQSQGNFGNTEGRPQAWAKNVISVGAAFHGNNADPSDDAWRHHASIGPSQDGRIKPDLYAYNEGVYTTTLNGGYTESFGGTSAATPIVAGYAGMIVQMWTDGIFSNPIDKNKSRFENRPHFTTTKALLIHSAKQKGFAGPNDDMTRTHQGWGFPDVKRLYGLRNDILVVNETNPLRGFETKTYQYRVIESKSEFRVTMTYADPPAAVISAVQRVNDLDLKVTSPEGHVFWGNHGLLEGPYSASGGSANKVDTVENIIVKDPAPGIWTVEVQAAEINVDAHLETPELDADYALVASSSD